MTTAIEVVKLVKTYGDVRAVDAVDFSVRPGEVFAFLGPNGAGKSTTVEILEGIRKRSSGEVRVLGLDPWSEGRRLQPRIGVIPQDFHFFPKLTPREAIELYAGLFGVTARTQELLARVELTDKADAHFDTLSGGQHQKLGLALALVNNPEVCFLDEPTTGLDPRARHSIWSLIRGLREEGRTVFLTTHYLEEARLLANRIGIIHQGHIIALGSPEEMIARYGRPERLRVVAKPEMAARVEAVMGRPVLIEDGTIEVEMRSKGDALKVLQAMEASGLPWTSFSTVEDTLDDVFLRLVGRIDDDQVENGPSRGRRP
jgi:ABC-2 type transport system ATP-binding protein